MKKRPLKSKSRTSLKARLTAYSATAGAAMLCTPGAQAAITNFTAGSGASNLFYNGMAITPGSTPTLVLTGLSPGGATSALLQAPVGASGQFQAHLSGRNHFTVSATAASNSANFHFAFSASNVGAGHDRIVSKLGFGDAIVGQNFVLSADLLARKTGTHVVGSFGNSAAGYVGFRFHANSQDYYGWLHLKVTADSHGAPDSIMLLPFSGDDSIYGAYGLAADDIKVGDVAAVPEPSTMALAGLSLLAVGAVGVREMRRRRMAAAK